MRLIGPTTDILEECGDTLIRRTTQFSDEFLSGLQCERSAKANTRAAEIDRVAAVPTHVADIWLRQGWDIYAASPREILARLRKEGLECFITTPKAV